MIKAFICGAETLDDLTAVSEAGIPVCNCYYRINDKGFCGSCDEYQKGKNPCDAEEVVITLLAKHEEVRAALAAAEEVLKDLVNEEFYGKDIRAALTKIRKVSNG